MIKASYYVFKDMEDLLERRNLVRLKAATEDYYARYNNDLELAEVCTQLLEVIESKNEKKMKELQKKLSELKDTRRL